MGNEVKVISSPNPALRIGLEIKSSHFSKVVASASKSPEKIGRGLLVDVCDRTIGKHNLVAS